MKSLFGKSPPETLLTYADTEVHRVTLADGVVTVVGTDYADAPLTAQFVGATILRSPERIERVEGGQVVKLRNGSKRLFLFDDDGVLFLEVEFTTCKLDAGE